MGETRKLIYCFGMAVQRSDWVSVPRNLKKLPLDRNESVDPVFQALVVDEIQELLKDPKLLFRYPNQARLFQAVAAFNEVPQENIFITNGSTDALERIIRKHQPNKFTLPSPTYDMVRVYGDLYAKGCAAVPFTLTEGGFHFDSVSFLKECQDADLIYIAQPDNPTGYLYPHSFIEELVALGKPLIIDEAYLEYAPGGKSFKEVATTTDHVYVVRTFSKFLGMCGFRLGYIISSKKNTDGFLNERIPYSTSSLATELMVNLLTNHKQALYETVQRVIQGKAYFESQIPCIPTYGNYSLAKMLPVRFKLLASYKEVMGLFRVSSGSEEVMKEVLMACKEPVE